MASEIGVTNFMQDLPNRALNIPVEERPELFKNVSASLSDPGINAVAIRGICKVIATTLTKYKDSKSQQLVRSLIVDLLKHHHDATMESMMAVFKVLSCKELPNAPPQKASKAALIALGWSVLLNKYGDPASNVYKTELLRLIEYQSMLYQIILNGLNERLTNLANDVFFELLDNDVCYQQYMLVLLKKEATSSVIVTLMLLILFKQQKEKNDILPEYRDSYLDIFVKAIITNKNKPHCSSIPACKLLLNSLTQGDFEKKLLPPMQRAMLRNPELILQAVGLIIQEVNLDFSPYALQLGKVLIQNLYSKDEVARSESVESLKQLSLKCSEENVIQELLKSIFDILNGSEGKITVAEYRVNLLQILLFLHLSFALANKTNDETKNTLNVTTVTETNATTTSLQPVAEPLVRYRRQPPRTIVKHIIRPKRIKMKRAKRPKIKYSFAEPPPTYYRSRPRYHSHKTPTFDSSLFEDFSHYNVESADFDLPPSSYEAQSMDLDLYKHYEAPAESEYKEVQKLPSYEYAGPEASYNEPEISYEEIKKPPSYSYSAPETTYKEPVKTYTYIPSKSSETRKPHTQYGVPTELVYTTGYDKPSFKPSKPIYAEIEKPSPYSPPPGKEEYSYNPPSKDEYSYSIPKEAPPRIPSTKYGVPDVHIPATGINDYNKYSVVEQKPSYASYTPTKSDKYNFAEPPQPQPNVEITYSPSYEINIPSSHENTYSSGNKYNVLHQQPASYEEPTQKYHPQIPPSYEQSANYEYPPQQYDHPPSEYETPKQNYEHQPGYQESSDTNHQPPSYHPAPPHHGSISEYIPQSQDLPIDVNHKQPPYNYPKSSYEVPIYDPIPFDASSNQEHEVYPPQPFDHSNRKQNSQKEFVAEPKHQTESEETPAGDAHSSGTRPLLQSTSQKPRSPITRLRKTRKRKRNRGSSTTTSSTTKHILDVPELEQAFENEKRNQLENQDTDIDAHESHKIQNINFYSGPWNPMKITTSPIMVTTPSTASPINISTTNSKRYTYKQRSTTTTTTTTTTESPIRENNIPNVEIISIEKSRSKSYYDGILSTPRVYNANIFRNRYKIENPTTASHSTPQKVTTNENKFSKRTTKNVFDTTIFKSPLNDRDLYRNLPKNHKLF